MALSNQNQDYVSVTSEPEFCPAGVLLPASKIYKREAINLANRFGQGLNSLTRDKKLFWFEPTDMSKAAKVFESELWSSLSFISPNLKELKTMHQAAGLPLDEYEKLLTSVQEDKFKYIARIAKSLVQHIGSAVVTLGKEGIMIVREGSDETPLLHSCVCGSRSDKKKKISARHYAVPHRLAEDKEVNVSGAGDCLAAGVMAAMLLGLPEAECVSAGFAMAYQSLHVASAVPEHASIPKHPQPARFNSLPL